MPALKRQPTPHPNAILAKAGSNKAASSHPSSSSNKQSASSSSSSAPARTAKRTATHAALDEDEDDGDRHEAPVPAKQKGKKQQANATPAATTATAAVSNKGNSKKQQQQQQQQQSKKARLEESNASSSVPSSKSEIAKALPASGTAGTARWTNKQRTLVLSSRGVTYRSRHLLNDLRTLMPHSKKDVKMDKKDKLVLVNEVCELKNCNNCIYLETRKKQDAYLWLAKTPSGPSVKFHIDSINTMDELRMTGNCLKGTRPLLSFDKNFETAPHLQLLKEIFTQVFGTPKGHPKSKPFFDHVFTFSIVDNRVWFRNFQIIDQVNEDKEVETTLNEVGPRFVLNTIRIFDGSFGGATIFENPDYVSPNEIRAAVRAKTQHKYTTKLVAKEAVERRKAGLVLPRDELDVFANRDEEEEDDEDEDE
ncbi:BXDC2 protein [Capsaspora owczarzaki ATCC 30864]|uniref:BXDC2 protein n=1 Tax=Capsaspora owczarzaki (strain ATCC 30864) TaxID=595528 RepID=A0A0D2WLP1_CAPO3|nr:BXDC2 protein [Capsaspora owczarzaki ATCC 30864]KJE90858.1 BXDC2 protein [Capsaspora owczarzaki ATCC 30864]|eukprot:XP_004348848.2 BXDC2 protein [Capsaspora owczarzaki ATCC 30864]